MNEFVNSTLIGGVAKALTADIDADAGSDRFPCRPFAARTSEGGTSLGRFKGQIGLSALGEFKNALDDLVTANLSKIILDLAAVSLTKSAVGVLVAFAASIHGRNKRLYLYRPSPQVRAVFKELGLTRYFSYLDAEDDLIATLVV